MIILDEFVDFIKVIRITMIAFYAEMSLDRFGKEWRFINVGLGDFVMTQCLCSASLKSLSMTDRSF